MTRSKVSPYSPKLTRKAEKQLSKQAIKESQIDRETIISQSYRYRREIVHNTINYPQSAWAYAECTDNLVHDKPKRVHRVASQRRNVGRMDGIQWNGDSFICEWQVDRGVGDVKVGYQTTEGTSEAEASEDEDYDSDSVQSTNPPPKIDISIWDIAKPAKPKGVAKEFEIIRTLARVITLEDEEDGNWADSEDGWEEVYSEGAAVDKKSYSAVLKENGG